MHRVARAWLAKSRGVKWPPLVAFLRDRSEGVAMIKRALMVIVAGVAIYLLIPRLGGLSRDAAALRTANLWLALLGIAAEVASIASYVTLYRSLLRAEHVEVPWLAAGRSVMSAFLISHVLPGGAAAGTSMNVRTIEREGGSSRRT